MNKLIVVTGATGFVGKKITLALLRKGYDVRVITRNKARAMEELPLPVSFCEWNGLSPFPTNALSGAYGVIHLAGENIADGRWNAKRKTAIEDSRTKATRALSDALAKLESPPKVLIGTSAIGLYGDRSDENLDESSPKGHGFLAEVCNNWEKSYESFTGRTVILRVGVVLGYGGALEKMLLPFRIGIGGNLASGLQWMSWIHIDDLTNMYLHALENPAVSGTYNAVAPEPVTNAEFTKVMGKTLQRPTFLPFPKLAIKLLFGEMSQVVLGSQKVSSKKITVAGFAFQYPTVSKALNQLLIPDGNAGVHVIECAQWIAKPRDQVFDFFSRAENLEKITPEWLNFRIKKKSTAEICEGTLIDYRLKIKGVPAYWRTLISTWRPGERFVDEQLKGPYSLWHHTHFFEELKGGTLMTDRVIYRVPLGPIGSLIEFIMIRHDVRKIFKYRQHTVEKVL